MKKSELKQMIREILERICVTGSKKKWVNIGKKDKDGKHPPCGTSGDKRGYAKCVPTSNCQQNDRQRKRKCNSQKTGCSK